MVKFTFILICIFTYMPIFFASTEQITAEDILIAKNQSSETPFITTTPPTTSNTNLSKEFNGKCKILPVDNNNKPQPALAALPFSQNKVQQMTGITNNPPLLRLATEAINQYQTLLERQSASEIWTSLSYITAPHFCAEAVTYVLQQKSLNDQRIVGYVWCAFLSKIVDPKLHSSIVEHVMSQPTSASIYKVACEQYDIFQHKNASEKRR